MVKLMASRNKDERALVNKLTKAILKNSPKTYIHIDRDSGSQRHTSSGFDFLLALHNRVVFCEAKIEKKSLSTWQEFTKAQVTAADVAYRVIRFTTDGKHFSIDSGKLIAISDACFLDIFKGNE
jgi:hypothetical protein